MSPLDTRINAVRTDLADVRLKGRVRADRFVAGETGHVIAPTAPLRRHPAPDAPMDSELLRGEPVRVFEMTGEGWAWAQSVDDDYVGWIGSEALASGEAAATHVVGVPRTLVFSGPDIKTPPLAFLPLGARVCVRDEARDHNARYALIAPAGAIVTQHLRRCDDTAGDFVATAESLSGTPYLWGGRSAFGLDCSGLIQIALQMSGIACPRDTDMQQDSLGEAVGSGTEMADLQRGDLVFWKGHAGIMRDDRTLLHANAHHMAVASEKLVETIARLHNAGLSVTAVRRLAKVQ